MPPKLQFLLATEQKACGGNYISEAVYQNCLCPFFKGRENSIERKYKPEEKINLVGNICVNLRAHPIIYNEVGSEKDSKKVRHGCVANSV